MKKIAVLLISTFICVSVFNPQAQACSMEPLDFALESPEMEKFTYVALGVAAERVLAITPSDITLQYVGNGPMCPDGVAAEATYLVNFLSSGDFEKQCRGIVKVSKQVPYVVGDAAIQHYFAVEIIEPANCSY